MQKQMPLRKELSPELRILSEEGVVAELALRWPCRSGMVQRWGQNEFRVAGASQLWGHLEER